MSSNLQSQLYNPLDSQAAIETELKMNRAILPLRTVSTSLKGYLQSSQFDKHNLGQPNPLSQNQVVLF